VGSLIQKLGECEKDIETFARGLDPDFKNSRGTLDGLKRPKKKEQFMTFVEQLRRYQGYLESAKSNDGLLTERAVTLMGESLAVGVKVLGGTREIQKKADEERKKAIWAKALDWLSPLDSDKLQKELYHG
jgi:hypothetical protein